MKRFTTLIQPLELQANLTDPRWVVLDCRFDLANPGAGRLAWQAGHIPGAQYAHLDHDLSSPVTATSGRHPLPDAEVLATRLGQWGVGNDSQVIAYDAANGAHAARLWWMLRWLGHTDVAVLDGGFAAWQRAQLPVDAGVPKHPARQFVAHARAAAWLTTAAVAESLARGDIALIDARGADRFAGQNETIDPVAGHIPGAVSAPFADNLDEQGRFRSPAELRAHYQALLEDVPPERTVTYCGSGVTAAHLLLALAHAGLGEARLYAGSWSDWITGGERPVATGSS